MKATTMVASFPTSLSSLSGPGVAGAGDGVAWAMNHPCSIICLVAGWLPEELVESGIKRLLMLARDCSTARLLILDVSLRKEWSREDADTPYPAEFLQKFTKDRRENVRVIIMDASKESGAVIPGISVDNLPTTVVLQGGKVAPGGVMQGFMRKDMQSVEALVRQSTAQSSTRSSTSSSLAPSDKPKEPGHRADSAAPLTLPEGIEMCPTTAASLFMDALPRVRALEGALASTKAGGTGNGTVLGKELQAVEQEIARAAADAEDMRFGGASSGAMKSSRAKRLHESGMATAQVCTSAEGLLDVCNAQSSMQEHLYRDIRKSLALLDPQAHWIQEDISFLRGITHADARNTSPPKVSPLAKNLRSQQAPTQPPSYREPVSPAWYVPMGLGSRGTPVVMWGGHVDSTATGTPQSDSSANTRRSALSVTHIHSSPTSSPSTASATVSPAEKDGKRGVSSVQEVLKLVGNLRVGSSPLGPANRRKT